MYKNRNGCASHKKVTKKEKFIHEYLEFDYQEGVGIMNDSIGMNSDTFIFSFQISKYVIKNKLS
jgi:hypothetical protein